MADLIQGQPGDPSQTTAAETTPALNSADAGAADSIPATTNNQPAPESGEVDWNTVDAGEYQRMKSELLGAEPAQGEPAPDGTTQPETNPPTEAETAAAAKAAEEAAAKKKADDEAAARAAEENADPFGEKFRPRLGKLPKQAQEAIQLVRELTELGTPISLAEAEKRVAAKYGTEPGTTETQQPEAPRTSAEIAAQIKDKRAEKLKLADQADVAGLVKLDDDIETLREQLAEAQRAEEAEAGEIERTLAETKASVIGRFPDFKDENSALSKEFTRQFDALAAKNSPILQLSDAEQMETISLMAAARLGIAPVDPKATAKPPAPTPNSPASTVTNPPQARPVQPASGSARTALPANPQLEQRIENVKTMDEYEKLKSEMLAAS